MLSRSSLNLMVSLPREFSVANRGQSALHAVFEAAVARTRANNGVGHSRKAWRQRDLRRTADVPDAAHLTASTSFRPRMGRAARRSSGAHLGRGWMTTGSTKPDAMPVSACAFVIAAQPVLNLGIPHGAIFRCATPLKPLAAHGATQRRPVRRFRSVGARRPGAPLNGYQKNAGGWHPPGRNADRRH